MFSDLIAALGPNAAVILVQLLVVVAVMATLFLGIWCRGVIDASDQAYSRRETIVMLIVGGFLIGIPLCLMANAATQGKNADLMLILATLGSPFASGFTAREQIKKWIASHDVAASTEPQPQVQ